MSSSEQEQTPITQTPQQTKASPSPVKQVSTSVPQTKKTASYTYWVDQKTKSRELPPSQRPQKIETPTSNLQNQNGRSNWNTAGTWENKKVNVSDLEKQYEEKLSEWLATACPEAKIGKVSLSGDCEVVFTRNKKVVTYEITGKVEFQKSIAASKQEQTEAEKQKPEQKSEKDSEPSNEEKESPKSKKKAKSPKSHQISIQIDDMTDNGDRDHSIKADTAEDKKWIRSQSSTVLSILEDIIKSYK